MKDVWQNLHLIEIQGMIQMDGGFWIQYEFVQSDFNPVEMREWFAQTWFPSYPMFLHSLLL